MTLWALCFVDPAVPEQFLWVWVWKDPLWMVQVKGTKSKECILTIWSVLFTLPVISFVLGSFLNLRVPNRDRNASNAALIEKSNLNMFTDGACDSSLINKSQRKKPCFWFPAKATVGGRLGSFASNFFSWNTLRERLHSHTLCAQNLLARVPFH